MCRDLWLQLSSEHPGREKLDFGIRLQEIQSDTLTYQSPKCQSIGEHLLQLSVQSECEKPWAEAINKAPVQPASQALVLNARPRRHGLTTQIFVGLASRWFKRVRAEEKFLKLSGGIPGCSRELEEFWRTPPLTRLLLMSVENPFSLNFEAPASSDWARAAGPLGEQCPPGEPTHDESRRSLAPNPS